MDTQIELALQLVREHQEIDLRNLAARVGMGMRQLAEILQGVESVTVNVGIGTGTGYRELPMRQWTVEWLGETDAETEEEEAEGDPDFDEVGFDDDHPGVIGMEFNGPD